VAKPPLDVLLVAYHSGAVLDACLATLADFAPEGTRIIVLDNSPDDPSAAEAVARVPGAELVSQRGNVGFAAAVNDGLARTNAELVLLLNPDILEIDGSFDAIREIFDRRPDAGAVTVHLTSGTGVLQHCRRRPTRMEFFNPAIGLENRFTSLREKHRSPMIEWDHADERVVDNATGALLFLRRTTVDDVGPLDERYFMYWEETDWLNRAYDRGWKLVYTPVVRGVHGNRQGSEVGRTTHSLLFLDSGYKFVGKHFGPATEWSLRLTWIAGDTARLLVGIRRDSAYRHEVAERLRVHLGLGGKRG
jgi:GT2 family glycosyltransferase